ncbi:ABC transporter substrate-binding protein [Vineibacter terrae]|uniref:ABC transporter substrate-binding protein n=1 Tax=Vineibacter terrae TaxID=2586908 RepID=UPI002E31C626|nr:ABC transporter substrate-binding protein [Vineibacter terrae]HEX2887647.1 ABC transporter substrate-binding protein [Vineibacter terrae]
MITRREFGFGAAALATIGLRGSPAGAQAKMVFQLANASGVTDASQCFITVGRHPKLGYYQAEGVDFEYVNMSNVSQALQSIATGESFLGALIPGMYLPVVAKNPAIGIVSVYTWLPRNANTVAVKPDSPFKTMADLKGKRIGIRNQGDSGRVVVKTMFNELGLGDGGAAFIAIGDAGPAGTALYADRVDAIASYDTAAARVEMAGFKLRYLPLTPVYGQQQSASIGANRKLLASRRNELVGFFRAMAKSTLTAHANPTQAIHAHWAQYPESRPKSKDETEAVSEMLFLLKRRLDNMMRDPADKDQRMGASNLDAWKGFIDMARQVSNDPDLATRLGDPNRLFTNELIDEVNDFDKAAIVKRAMEFAV